MIISLLLTIFYGAVGLAFSLLELLPMSDSTLPQAFSTGIVNVMTYAHGWNWILPVDESIQIIRWTVILYIGVFGWKSVKWAIATLRGSSVGV